MHRGPFLAALVVLMLGAGSALGQTVSNVRAAQRAGSNLVDIYYDLSGGTPPLSVTVAVSSDNGATYAVPASSLTGHVGANVAAGSNRRITWNAGADWANQFSAGMKVKVTASDTPPAPTGMALIPAGSFSMGDAFSEGDSDEQPVHTVNAGTFYMDRYEVSKALWDEVRAWGSTHGYTDLATGVGKAANHPVHTVTWWDAVKWCNARSQKEGLTPCYTVSGVVMKTGTTAPAVSWNANGYRLPTEAEWEKAARGGLSGKRFPWGDTISHSQANYSVVLNYWYVPPMNLISYDVSPTAGNHPAYNDGVQPYTSPVGSFAANPYGLHDMAGNVWEWCWDWYSSDYTTSVASDPRGPSSGSHRLYRSGGWNSRADNCRIANRGHYIPNSSHNGLGFRCIRGSVP